MIEIGGLIRRHLHLPTQIAHRAVLHLLGNPLTRVGGHGFGPQFEKIPHHQPRATPLQHRPPSSIG